MKMNSITLTASEKDKLANGLRARRAELFNRIRVFLHGFGDPEKLSLANHLEEVGNWAQAEAFNAADMALIKHDVAELGEIDAALRRIADGSYGICTGCGEMIGIARLQAQPTAQTCLACKHAFEKRRGFVHTGI